MDDIKLYAETNGNPNKLTNIVSIFSRGIGMEFRLGRSVRQYIYNQRKN